MFACFLKGMADCFLCKPGGLWTQQQADNGIISRKCFWGYSVVTWGRKGDSINGIGRQN